MPFSWVYGAVMSVRNYCYDKRIFRVEKAGIPVISVGNMTSGGTGKTPFVEYLVRYFLARNKRVAVLSRGYGRESAETVAIGAGETDRGTASRIGDEPFQMARKFPNITVVADTDRVRGAAVAHKQHSAQVIILDDGFQHRALARDLDIVMINADSDVNMIPMLPAGLRREPLSGLRRADLVAYSSKTMDGITETRTSKVQMPSINVGFKPKCFRSVPSMSEVPLSELAGKVCVAFCGIAEPESFKTMLRKLHAEPGEFFVFGDHHRYTSGELESIRNSAKARENTGIVTTEKDSARFEPKDIAIVTDNGKIPLYFLEIEAVILEGAELLNSMLDKTLANA